MHVLMVAAENGAIPGGKVGGIGDVIRDVPVALNRRGHQVSVITPGYERLSKNFDATFCTTLTVNFCGHLEQVSLFRRDVKNKGGLTSHWIIENPLFAAGGEGVIYCEDHHGPYATDGHKFALLCLAVCHAVLTGAIPKPDVMHLHDWHAALVLFLCRHVSAYKPLQKIPTVFSIHNLSIQGIRPFAHNGSSLEAWFSTVSYSRDLICDPRDRDCVNLMRMGINMAGKVHVVSPHYAREIVQPSRPEKAFVGGEGLEDDLQRALHSQRLVGILNGCEYPGSAVVKPTRAEFITLANRCLLEWVGHEQWISTAWFFAQQRLTTWSVKPESEFSVVASIGRLVWQKVGLLGHELPGGKLAIDVMLEKHPEVLLVILGSGDTHFENLMSGVMARHHNFIFLRGYSEALASSLYAYCDAFLMPSTYEPCGISQLLALRAGKPCLVHGVGGLVDTVKDGVSGLVFSGESMQEKAVAMLESYDRLLQIKATEPEKWKGLQQAALATHFDWDASVDEYLRRLYPSANL